MAFHALIEKWMLAYCFKAIGQDLVTFLLQCGNIKQDVANKCTKLTQAQYTRDVLESFRMTGATPVSMPMEPNTHLTVADCPQPYKRNKEFIREYQGIIGVLMYLANLMRPDLAHSVNQCSKFMLNSGPSHMIATSRILKYLAQPESRANLLWGLADTDHAGDPDTCRSVVGYVLMLSGAAISWSSTRQAVVALSSSLEAEFYAASNTGCLRTVLEQLGCKQQHPTIVFKDNWA
eukprot:3223678-Rhodomonas_salina.1